MKTLIFTFFFVIGLFFIAPHQTPAHPAWAIVVDDANQIYVSDLEKIWKIDAAGVVSVFSERHTHEMRLDKNGNLLGEELNYEPSTGKYTSALWKITTKGEFSYTLAPTETPPKGISIWMNQTGATYYFGQTENEQPENFLLKRSADGNVKVLFGNLQKAMQHRQIIPYSIAGMTFAPDGSLYVKNKTIIWKVAADDSVAVYVDEKKLSPVVPNAMLFGLSVDEQNNVYTADHTNKKILKIAPDKKISIVAESETSWAPTGVYYKKSNLYVLEYKAVPGGALPIVRVRKIAPDGKISTIATIGDNQKASPNNSTQQNSSNIISGNQFQATERSNKLCAAIGLIATICIGFVLRRKL